MTEAGRFALRLRDAIEGWPEMRTALDRIAAMVGRYGADDEVLEHLDKLAGALIERDPLLATLGSMSRPTVMAALAQSVGIEAEPVAIAVRAAPSDGSRLN
jgi:hypothetical protein